MTDAEKLAGRYNTAREKAQKAAAFPGHRVRAVIGAFQVEKFDGKRWVFVNSFYV